VVGARHVVIGGSGFLGAFLVDRLRESDESLVVVDLTPPPVDVPFIRADISKFDQVQAIPLTEGSVVYHLAARQYNRELPATNLGTYFNEVNVTGTRNILEHMRRHGSTRLVFISSDMVYGLPESVPVTVSHPRNPLGPYGASKVAAEDLTLSYAKHGIGTVVLRPRLIVGPGRYGVLTRVFALIHRGLPIPIVGDGENRYQMIGASDCAAAIIAAVQKEKYGQVYNLGSANPPTIRQLLTHVIKSSRSRSTLVPMPARAVKFVLHALERVRLSPLYREQYEIADTDFIVDVGRTADELDWYPQQSDCDMLTQAYNSYLTRVSR
jgi:nucleoside-diphosphate-sugar epimerase